MKTITLMIRDATHAEKIEGVASFVGEDASGSFGLLADHTRFMTTLMPGLARYRLAGQPWQYLAQPGSVLSLQENILSISTRHYFRDEDYMRISNELVQKLFAEEEKLLVVKHSLQQMEKGILRHIWELRRQEGASL